MSEVEQFQFGDRQVRVIDRGGEPWWVARDVCDVLGIGNPSQAVSYLDEDESLQHPLITNEGSRLVTRTVAIVNESGLYSLILRSRKPEAKAFKKWVTSEVLPSIRRTGSYQVPVNIEVTIKQALAEMAHNEHVVPAAARILSFKRWRNPDKGIKAFIQLSLDLNLPAIDAGGKKEITRGKEG